MSDNRQKYKDSFNPVVNLDEHHLDEQSAPDDSINQIGRFEEKRRKGPKGKKVRSGQNSKKGSAKSAASNGSTKNASAAGQTAVDSLKALFSGQIVRWLSGLVLGGFAIYLLVAFISYFSHCIEDQAAIINSGVGSLPPVGNKAGEGGARLSEFFINGSFGLGSFVIILWLGVVALKLLTGWPRFKTVNFTIKCIVALITVSLIIGLITIASDTPVNWGGYHGRYVNEFIIGFTGWIGGVILCFIFILAFFIICMRDLVNWILRKKKEIAERRREALRIKHEQEELERELAEMRMREEMDAIRAGEASDPGKEVIDEDNLVKFDERDVEIDPSLQGYDIDDEPIENYSKEEETADYSLDNENDPDSEKNYIADDNIPEEVDDTSESEDKSAESDGGSSESEDKSAGDPMIVNLNHIAKADDAQKDNENHGSIKTKYKLPPSDLLREGSHKMTVDEVEQGANQERIRETLLYHKIPITKIEATVGPTVTLYEVRPEQGVKIAKIKNLADDIALSLAAKGVRVIAPIPGKGTVGIEVANAEPQTVSMRTIIESRKYAETRYRLPLALGSTIGNDVYIADLSKMPHLLVAGATGQGKSVGLNAIIASLLYKKRPDELKLVLIDPKEVEFSFYSKIESHYLAKLEDSEAIVTDMAKVVPTLQSLCLEMDNRYKLLRSAHVRNIEEYNSKIEHKELRPEDGHKFLPYIVLVVDEFADLIMTSGKEVETPIARLAQKARAIGIHVIIATQRPSTDVITGLIKSNFPVRLAFKVSAPVDSNIILGTTGAQQLIGNGDMLISNNTEMIRVQCAFIDTPEVEKICDYIGRQPFNAGPYILPDPLLAEGGDGASGHISGPESLDPLFTEVAEIVVGSGVGSTSGIQRRLSIGYNRAGKIMDQLEHYGVVGPSMGGKPRQVLMDMNGLYELLQTLHL